MKGMIFCTDSVLAINRPENPKTRTSRVITDKDIIYGFDCEKDGTPIAYIDQETGDHYPPNALARYKPGEIVYLKEAWSFQPCSKCDGNCCVPAPDELNGNPGCYVYRTNYGTTEDDSYPPSMFQWRSPITMPFSAARTFLKITEVFPQRIQEIPYEDIEREGLYVDRTLYTTGDDQIRRDYKRALRTRFARLWDSINAKRGYPYDSNPYIWAYRFEKTERP